MAGAALLRLLSVICVYIHDSCPDCGANCWLVCTACVLLVIAGYDCLLLAYCGLSIPHDEICYEGVAWLACLAGCGVDTGPRDADACIAPEFLQCFDGQGG